MSSVDSTLTPFQQEQRRNADKRPKQQQKKRFGNMTTTNANKNYCYYHPTSSTASVTTTSIIASTDTMLITKQRQLNNNKQHNPGHASRASPVRRHPAAVASMVSGVNKRLPRVGQWGHPFFSPLFSPYNPSTLCWTLTSSCKCVIIESATRWLCSSLYLLHNQMFYGNVQKNLVAPSCFPRKASEKC